MSTANIAMTTDQAPTISGAIPAGYRVEIRNPSDDSLVVGFNSSTPTFAPQSINLAFGTYKAVAMRMGNDGHPVAAPVGSTFTYAQPMVDAPKTVTISVS